MSKRKLIYLIGLYRKMWGSVNEERTVDVAYLYFGFYFDRFFHSKLVSKLGKLGKL